MSPTNKTHSSSTLSTSSSSASIQRHSYPTTTPHKDPTHHRRRNVHSAPATFSAQQSRKQASNLTLSSTSTDYASDDSTAVASSSTSTSTSTHAKSKPLSAEDEFWANKINAELATKVKAEVNEEKSKVKAKAKRGCMGAIADEFDFEYANVPSRGSRGGRKSAGGTGLGRCELM